MQTELQRNMMLMAQDTLAASSGLEASDMFACNPLAVETMRVCANVTFEKNVSLQSLSLCVCVRKSMFHLIHFLFAACFSLVGVGSSE